MSSFRNLKIGKFVKTLLIVLLIIFLLIAAVVVFLWNKLDLINFADEVSDEVTFEYSDEPFEEYSVDLGDMELSETAPVIQNSEIHSKPNVINILLIGTDERNMEFHYHARSDSMILVSINMDINTVKLVSFERAIGVPILEGELAGQYDLLTHIFRWGGSELLVKTIEHCFKIDIDHYVRLNFSSVRGIVDAIDGIDIELTQKEADGLNGGLLTYHILQAGVNHLDGEEALAFARLRSIDSDWQRVERQRKVILAVVDKLKGSSLITLNELANTVLPMIQTDMSKMDIAELMVYAPNFLNSTFDQMTIPKQGTYGGMKIRTPGGAFAVDYDINNDLLYRFLYEGATSEELLAE